MNLVVGPLPPQDEGLEFPYSSLPHLAAWIGRMEADPAVLQYSLPQQVHTDFIKTLVSGAPNYDIIVDK